MANTFSWSGDPVGPLAERGEVKAAMRCPDDRADSITITGGPEREGYG